MDRGVAVAFRRGGEQIARAFFERQIEGAARADGAHVQGFDGMLQVVLGTGGRCHVQHAIHGTFHRKLVGDILLAKREARLRRQMRQIAAGACEKVIQPNHRVPFRQ